MTDSIDLLPPALPPPLPEKALVWSPGYTGIWAGVIGFMYLFTQTVALVVYAIVASPRFDEDAFTELILNGDCVSILVLCSAMVLIPLILILIRLKKGLPVHAYLSLRAPRLKECLFWIAILVGSLYLMEGFSYLIRREVEVDFMIELVSSSSSPVLLFAALVVAAPVWEEMFFRGFLFTGWQHSRLGDRGTVWVTSLMFAMIHTQYDLYTMGQILIVGLLFGWARVKTGSLWVPILMHMVMNALATVQTYLHLR